MLGKEGSEVIFIPVFLTNFLGDSDVRTDLGSSRRDHQIESRSRLSHSTPHGLEQLLGISPERQHQCVAEAKECARDQSQQARDHRERQPPNFLSH